MLFNYCIYIHTCYIFTHMRTHRRTLIHTIHIRTHVLAYAYIIIPCRYHTWQYVYMYMYEGVWSVCVHRTSPNSSELPKNHNDSLIVRMIYYWMSVYIFHIRIHMYPIFHVLVSLYTRIGIVERDRSHTNHEMVSRIMDQFGVCSLFRFCSFNDRINNQKILADA